MIIFLCTYGIGFPNGTGETARVTAYAKGMLGAGEEVLLLLLDTSEYGDNPLNHQPKGTINGIPFEYTCGTPLRGKNFFHRRWLTIKGVLVATLRIMQIRKNKHIEGIWLNGGLLFPTLWFWITSRLWKVPIVNEKDEHPFLDSGDGILDRIYQYLYTRLVLWRFDGMIVISDYLETYLGKILRPGERIIKIPLLVDSLFFNTIALPVVSEPRNITYCGLLNENKDGVLTLMKAFREIYRDYPDLYLRLIGDSYRESKIPEYKKYAEEMGIAEQVEFIGKVQRDLLPMYFQRATILALARPTSLQATAGVPTKVGEYLASGKPVVVTRTGELANYLEDGVNVYFSEPNDYMKFADRLRNALDHPDGALEIGRKGQAIAQDCFNSLTNMRRLVSFIRSFPSA